MSIFSTTFRQRSTLQEGIYVPSSDDATDSMLRKFLWLEPLWILALAPSILFPGRFWTEELHPFLVLLLFLFWPIRLLAYKRWTLRTPLAWPLALILFGLPLNVGVSIDPARTWQATGYLLFGICLYFAVINWLPFRRQPNDLGKVVLAIGFGLTLLGPLVIGVDTVPWLQATGIQLPLGVVGQQIGERVNANVLAGSLVLFLPYWCALMLFAHRLPIKSRRKNRTKSWGLFIVACLLLLLTAGVLSFTASRGGYVAVVCACLLLVCLRWPQLGKFVPLLLLAIGAAIYWAGFQPILETIAADDKLGGLDGRIEIWQRGLLLWRDFTWTGIGIGLFGAVVPRLYPYFSVATNDVPHVHNLFLQVGIDLGLLGAVAYIGMLVVAIGMLIHTLKPKNQSKPTVENNSKESTISSAEPVQDGAEHNKTEQREEQVNMPQKETQNKHYHKVVWRLDDVFAAGTLAAIMAMLIHGIVDAAVWDNKLAFVPWLLFALATRLYIGPVQRRMVRTRRRFG